MSLLIRVFDSLLPFDLVDVHPVEQPPVLEADFFVEPGDVRGAVQNNFITAYQLS